MEHLQRFVDKDRFARFLGIEFLEIGEGWARARLTIDQNHLNSVGTVHGGVVFSLADAVFSAASNSRGNVAVAIQVSISFFKAVSGGTLFAQAREIDLNPKLATYSIEISDDEGNSVARFQGTAYRKRGRIEELPE